MPEADPLPPSPTESQETPPEEVTPPDDEELVIGAGIDWANPNSRWAPYYCRTATVVAVAVLAFTFVVLTRTRVWHTDIWGHMRFGEVMVKEGRLPTHAGFPDDMVDPSTPYINFQWITQAGSYLLFEAGKAVSATDPDHALGGGAQMLLTAFALIVTARLGILLLAFRRLTNNTATALIGVLLVLALSFLYHLFILRPQIVGELAFACLLLPLSRPLLSRRALWAIPGVMVFWANAHGSFPVGFVLLGLFLTGRGLQILQEQLTQGWRRTVQSLWHDAQLRRLTMVLLFSVIAVGVLNPSGPWLYYYTVKFSSHPNIPFMEEWKPLPIKQPVGWLFLTTMGMLVLLLRFSPSRFTPTQVLLLLAFGLQTLSHVRMFVWWCMVFVWVIIPHLDAVLQHYLPGWLSQEAHVDGRKTIFALMLGSMLVLWSAPLQWLLFKDAPLASQRVTALTPRAAVEYLRAQYNHDPEHKLHGVVFASESLGDFLLWELRQPGVRIYCYSHVHLFTREHWDKCFRIKSADHTWEQIADQEGIDFIVVERHFYSSATGAFDLIDKIKASPNWEEAPESVGQPVFIARRKSKGSGHSG